MNEKTATQPVLTPTEAAELLRVTPETLLEWESRPGFPAPARITKRTVRYSRDKLLAWLESHSGELR